MGEVSQVVFVSEILAQIRGRGIDLDRLGQHKSLQDGLTLAKKEAIQHLTKLLVDQMQKAPLQEAPAPEGSPPPPPNRVQSPKQLFRETDLWLLILLNCC